MNRDLQNELLLSLANYLQDKKLDKTYTEDDQELIEELSRVIAGDISEDEKLP